MGFINGNFNRISMINLFIIGTFFCYGVFTLQRRGFLLEKVPDFWRKFPKKLHEPLFGCGVCVSSIWGIFFIVSQHLIKVYIPKEYIDLATIPFYIVAMCGFCAILDRAVKFLEYGYKYNNISPLVDYSYLDNYKFRDSLYDCFLKEVLAKGIWIVEIGGNTPSLVDSKYTSINKQDGNAISYLPASEEYFVLIKGIAYEGNFDNLLQILSTAAGFIVEGSTNMQSGKQIQWIMDKFDLTIRLPYSVNDNIECRPEHCGNTNNRIVLVKPLK
jgi:hypothetical protein